MAKVNTRSACEYHKPYKRFNQIVKVPRGQASYTLDESIYYDYKVSGGSPPNYIMCPRLKEMTARVNEALGTNFNTILPALTPALNIRALQYWQRAKKRHLF